MRDLLTEEAAAEQARRCNLGRSINHGYKYAFLRSHAGTLVFDPISTTDYYGVSADAKCFRHSSPAPQEKCTCGFWSLVLRSHLGKSGTQSELTQRRQRRALILEVESSGALIRGDWGLRAEHIEVYSATLPSMCWRCKTAAVGLIALSDGIMTPCCHKHGSEANQVVLPIASIRRELQTQVLWAETPKPERKNRRT